MFIKVRYAHGCDIPPRRGRWGGLLVGYGLMFIGASLIALLTGVLAWGHGAGFVSASTAAFYAALGTMALLVRFSYQGAGESLPRRTWFYDAPRVGLTARVSAP